MKDLRDITILLVAVILLSVGLIMGLDYAGKKDCQAIAENGNPTNWQGLVEGCFVEVNGGYIPAENWRVTND